MASSNSTDPASVQNTTDNSVLNSTSARAVSLIVIMLLGLVGNIFVITAIGSNKKLKTSAVYIFSLNMAITNILDCFLNMSLTLGATVANSWELGEVMCRLSSFFMMLLSIELTLSLTFMTLDRMIATKHWSKYDELQNIPRTCTMVAYTWIHSLAFSLPIATGTVPSKVHSKIYSCMISDKTSFIYVCILSISSFIIPLIIIFSLFIVIMKTAYTERSAVRAMLAQHQYSRDIEEPKFCKELYAAKYVGVLVCFWIILHLPYIINLFLHLYKYSPELNMGAEITVEYIWHCDTIVMWMKFSFVIVIPVLLFICNKDLWHTLRDVARCRKNNAVVDIVGKSDPKIREKTKFDEKTSAKEEKVKEAFTHNSGFQIPVLFATSNGVHIQTYDEEAESVCNDHVIRGKKCDVIGSQDLLNQVASEETSDYDSGSEIDPFSVSHPISSKNLNKNPNLAQRRSNSHPEVRSKTKTINRNSDTLVSTTTDSGLDISSSGNTLTLKTVAVKPDGRDQNRQSSHSADDVHSEINQIPVINNNSQIQTPHICTTNQKSDDSIHNEVSFVNSRSQNSLANSSNDINNAFSSQNQWLHTNEMVLKESPSPQFDNNKDQQSNCVKEEIYKCVTPSAEGDFADEENSSDKNHLEIENRNLPETRSPDHGIINERVLVNVEEMQSSVYCNDNMCNEMHSNGDNTCSIAPEAENDSLENPTSVMEITDDQNINGKVGKLKNKNPIISTSNKKRQKKQSKNSKEKLHQSEISSTSLESQISGLLRPPVRLEPLINTRPLYSRLMEEGMETSPLEQDSLSINKSSGHQHDGNDTKFDALRTSDESKSDISPKRTLKEKKLTGVTNLLLNDLPSNNSDVVVTPSACDIIDISKNATERDSSEDV